MKYNKTLFVLLAILLSVGCQDPFIPTGSSASLNYLVVDGYINSADGTGTIKLTRTKALNNSGPVPLESNAQVILQEENGENYPFTEIEEGLYQLSSVSITTSKKYKLKIITDSNIEYESDLVSVNQTPEIDSINWKQLGDKIEVYANTHNDLNNSHYYRWKYNETWQYNSAFRSSVKIQGNTIVFRNNAEDNIYNCYKTAPSSSILIHSTSKLEENAVREFRILSYSTSSLKLLAHYSIEVEQYAITQDAYEYWELLKKTTENLGSLFDPQPIQVTGNINCISNPSEVAIGYFSVGNVSKKRIFIHSTEITYPVGTKPKDPYYNNCKEDMLRLNELPGYEGSDLLVSPVYNGIFLVGYTKSIPTCVDCRFGGGTNVKPEFWP